MKNLIIIILIALILIVPVTSADTVKIEVRGTVFDEDSSTYNNTLQWSAENFEYFWYSLGSGKSSETLTIGKQVNASSRTIEKGILVYKTQRRDQKYKVFSEKNKKVENGLDYNKTTKTFTRNPTGGYYAQLGWFGGKYAAVNGKANKLAKIIKEQKADDKKTLTAGEVWDLGQGYTLTANDIDVNGKQAHLIFSQDETILADIILSEKEVYTNIQSSLGGESHVPVFVTYAETIFAGMSGNVVQLKYTWLISQDVIEINSGDKFEAFKVKEATEDYLLLSNNEDITLKQNEVINLAGGIKFKVADKSTSLRFYPFKEYVIETAPVESKETNTDNPVVPTATSTVSTAAQTPRSTAAQTATPVTTTPQVKTSGQNLPGFEAIYAILGLTGAVYISQRKRN